MPETDMNLRVPGPTPVPAEVATAGSQPMVNHRGPEFAASMAAVLEGLKPFFGSESQPLLLTGSGTGALEAAVVNVLSPGDKVLSVTGGVFGDRFAAIAQAFGADVRFLRVEWREAAQVDAVVDAARGIPNLKAVLLTHNETSTGVTNDLPLIAAQLRSYVPQSLLLVDGVSSVGALPFEFDAWDLDVAVTGSQKAWMSPPGLSMIAVSERAWAAHRSATMPRFYWDFTKAQASGEKHTTPFTPAVGIVLALQTALSLMSSESKDAIFSRHERIGSRLRTGLHGLGLDLFAELQVASNTVTAVRLPERPSGSELIRDLRERGIVVAGGQDCLKGKIFRIGHMGWVHEEDIDAVLGALRDCLKGSIVEAAI